MSTWYEELNFDENPLDARPNPNLVGLDDEAERLKNHILKEELCFLNGLTGSGKTSLLLKVQKELKHYKFIYLDAQDMPKNFNLEEELKSKRSFFDRLTFRQFPKKKAVLLIDEFQSTNPNLITDARGKWESQDRKIKAIVIAQISKYLKNVSDSFKDRLGHRIITLKPLDDEDMEEILKRRLYNEKTESNHIEKFDEDAVNLLVKVADGNARRLLEYADMLFDFHHRSFKDSNPITAKGAYRINYNAAKLILERNSISTDEFEKETPKKKRGNFEDVFSQRQQKILEFLNEFDRVTVIGIARKLKIAESTARKSISALKKQKAVIVAGKKHNRELLAVAPYIRRLMSVE